MNPTFSFVVMTWNRDASWLRNSVYTLSHQTVQPLEIIVVEASPDNARHEETEKMCAAFPLVTVIHARWKHFNIARGFNVGIKASASGATHVACTCMEIYFAANLVEELEKVADYRRFNNVTCGSLLKSVGWPKAEDVLAKWDYYCTKTNPYPAHLSPGALMCAPRRWWHLVHGYDEKNTPYAYPDVDIRDRAIRDALKGYNVRGVDAMVLHPWHGPDEKFHSVSGRIVRDGSIIRNEGAWGEI